MPYDDDDSNTPIGAPPSLDGVDRRLRQTLDAVNECVSDTKATRSELAAHRQHDETALAAIHKEIGEQKSVSSHAAIKIGEMQGQLTTIATTAAKAEGALTILVADSEARRNVETARALSVIETEKQRHIADTDVDKSKQIAKVEDEADKKKTWRDVAKKVLAGLITFIVGAATAYFGLS